MTCFAKPLEEKAFLTPLVFHHLGRFSMLFVPVHLCPTPLASVPKPCGSGFVVVAGTIGKRTRIVLMPAFAISAKKRT